MMEPHDGPVDIDYNDAAVNQRSGDNGKSLDCRYRLITMRPGDNISCFLGIIVFQQQYLM